MRSMKWWLHHHGGRRLGEEAEIMVDVSVLAFAKVSFNIQRLSTVELRRLCMDASLKLNVRDFWTIVQINLTGKEIEGESEGGAIN